MEGVIMKIFLNEKLVFELEDWQVALLYDGICEDVPADVARRLKWVIDQKLDSQLNEMKLHWLPILQNDDSIASLPKKDADLVKLIVSRDDYKNASERDVQL